MMDCQRLSFSSTVGAERRRKAEGLLGKAVVSKILGVALYWLGARRPDIASELGIAENSLRTTVRVFLRDGLAALEDRRRGHRQCAFLPPPPCPSAEVLTLAREDDAIAVRFGAVDTPLTIAATNRLQCRVVLLSLVNCGLISPSRVGEVLELSSVHVRDLASRLAAEDVEALLDRRHGQQIEPVLTPQVKAEIILQYSANAVTGRSTSSKAVVADISERSRLTLSDRTLRHCIAKLGLGKLATDLPKLVERIKKGSRR